MLIARLMSIFSCLWKCPATKLTVMVHQNIASNPLLHVLVILYDASHMRMDLKQVKSPLTSQHCFLCVCWEESCARAYTHAYSHAYHDAGIKPAWRDKTCATHT